jgi:hypothetical protein
MVAIIKREIQNISQNKPIIPKIYNNKRKIISTNTIIMNILELRLPL